MSEQPETITVNRNIATNSVTAQLREIEQAAGHSHRIIETSRRTLRTTLNNGRVNLELYYTKLRFARRVFSNLKSQLDALNKEESLENINSKWIVTRRKRLQRQFIRAIRMANTYISDSLIDYALPSGDISGENFQVYARDTLDKIKRLLDSVSSDRNSNRLTLRHEISSWNRRQKEISDLRLKRALNEYHTSDEDASVNLKELQTALKNLAQVSSATVEFIQRPFNNGTSVLRVVLQLPRIVMKSAASDEQTYRIFDEYGLCVSDDEIFNIVMPPLELRIELETNDLTKYSLSLESPVNCYGYEGIFTPHPHWISASSPCLGSFEGTFYELLHDADIINAVQCLVAFIESYDPTDSAGRYAAEFYNTLMNCEPGFHRPVSRYSIFDPDDVRYRTGDEDEYGDPETEIADCYDDAELAFREDDWLHTSPWNETLSYSEAQKLLNPEPAETVELPPEPDNLEALINA